MPQFTLKNANLASLTHLTEWFRRKTASYADLELSRTSTDKKAAKSAVSTLTLAKVKTFASALATIELIQPQTQHADVRVALTTSMKKKSQREMSVI